MANTRPTAAPDFATDTNYPAGGNPWNAQPNKVSPAGVLQTGFLPTTYLASEHVNERLNNHGQFIRHMDSTGRRNFMRAMWGNWSSPIGATDAYAGDWRITFDAGDVPTVSFTALYNAGVASMTCSNTKLTNIMGATSSGLFVINSYLVASFEVDLLMTVVGANNLTIAAGVSNGTSGSFKGALFWKASANTNWQAKTDDGTTTTTDLGIPPVANVFQNLRIDIYGSADAGGLRCEFYVNGSLMATHTTHIDTTNAILPRVSLLGTGVNTTAVIVGGPAIAWSRASGY